MSQGALYILLFMLPISKAAIEILFVVLLVAWLVEHVQTRWATSVWRHPRSWWCLAALSGYLSVCGLSVLTGDSGYHWLSLRGFVGKTLEYALFFVIAADIAHKPSVMRRALWVLVASAWLIGVDAVVQQRFGRDLLLGHTMLIYSRMTGPYENPVDLATYLLVVIPIVLVHAGDRLVKGRWIAWILLVLLVGCLLRTHSLGAQLALVGALMLFLGLTRRGGRRRWLVLGFLGLLFVATINLKLQGSMSVGTRSQPRAGVFDAGVPDRLFIWQAAWHMITDRPIIGHGLNTFMANYLRYWVGGEQQPRYAHNCFLQVAAETGIVGLAAFLWLLGTLGVLWMRAVRRAEGSREGAWLLALTVGLVGFLAQSAIDTNFYALRQATLFWTLAGMATGLAIELMQRPGHSGRSAAGG